MKVLFNNHVPFGLAHGGAQIQIEQTQIALSKIGVDAEPLRWWDDKQSGDILHQFGALLPPVIELARAKGLKLIVTILLTEQCNRSESALLVRRAGVGVLLSLPWPRSIKAQLYWQAAREYDRLVVGLEAERQVLETVYGISRERISIVPLGLTDAFRKSPPASRTQDHLICTGTITPSKNSLELAQLAIQARVPILFVGKPYDSSGSYWKAFEQLIDNQFVRHHPHVSNGSELIELLRSARGYVLMSQYENWSLAAHEAAGCGLPLLLPDQNWSRERFGTEVRYFPKRKYGAIPALRQFYFDCPSLTAPRVHLPGWIEVAEQLRSVYADVLTRPAFTK